LEHSHKITVCLPHTYTGHSIQAILDLLMSPLMRVEAVVIFSIVVLFAGAGAIVPTYAASTINLKLTPSNPAYGDLVEFQGTISPSAGTSQQIAVNLYRGSGCNLSQYLFNVEGSTESTGSSFSVYVRLGVAYLVYVGPGIYSAFAYLSSSPNISSSCVNFAVSAAVPEFPVGLPVLLIFTLIACVLITRGTAQRRQIR
jgi:hypothetical protein